MNFGCEVGVGADGVAPRHRPHHGHDLAGQRHLGEAQATRQGAHCFLMIGPSERERERETHTGRGMGWSWNADIKLLCNFTAPLQYIVSVLSLKTLQATYFLKEKRVCMCFVCDRKQKILRAGSLKVPFQLNWSLQTVTASVKEFRWTKGSRLEVKRENMGGQTWTSTQ